MTIQLTSNDVRRAVFHLCRRSGEVPTSAEAGSVVIDGLGELPDDSDSAICMVEFLERE